jgi:hypothetical protein
MASERPRWSMTLQNESVRRWKASFMDLPEGHRPLFLRLTGCAPPAVLGDSVASQLAFRRIEDMFQQARSKQKLFALIDAAEQVTQEMTQPKEAASGSLRPAVDLRFLRTWDEAALRSWCDRLEVLCAPHDILPRLKLYA